jgi:Flp pilus assembly pilin Flp
LETQEGSLVSEVRKQIMEDTKEMASILKNFVREEQGQDLIEYTLLLAFVCLASAALFIGAGQSINAIWTQANTTLSQAKSAASAGS